MNHDTSNAAGTGRISGDELLRSRLVARLEQAGRLSEVERQALYDLPFRARAVPQHTDVDVDGASQSVHLILSGIACRYKLWPGGTRRVISLILPGDLCDGHRPLPFMLGNTVGTLTPCRVAEIPRQAIADLIEVYPRIARAFWWMTLVKLSIFQEWLASTGRAADKQLAHIFCELLVRLRTVGLADETSFELGLTQGDIADVVGISPVHANRVLRSLRNSGQIVFDQRRLTIPDFERLKALAEFDPAYLHNGAEFGRSLCMLATSARRDATCDRRAGLVASP
ncbi:Crp/Fnr family transcriptional regulator [Methylobacterium fujisawaense]|jgi:CRP-like cAMP-binding protein|uniref:Crp/Fnr family transcriptional regulator n=1 Tax=Methylobacterium fujisawaense TaxID=107400 RepID=UPI0031F51D96